MQPTLLVRKLGYKVENSMRCDLYSAERVLNNTIHLAPSTTNCTGASVPKFYLHCCVRTQVSALRVRIDENPPLFSSDTIEPGGRIYIVNAALDCHHDGVIEGNPIKGLHCHPQPH